MEHGVLGHAIESREHLAEFADMLPNNNEEHSDLVHKSTLLAAWVQVGGGILGGFFGFAALLWFLRRRRLKKAAADGAP